MSHDTDELWARFDDTPSDMGLLRVIADHYRDNGNDEYADCLQWCAENGRMPTTNCYQRWTWCTLWYYFGKWNNKNYYIHGKWDNYFFQSLSNKSNDRRLRWRYCHPRSLPSLVPTLVRRDGCGIIPRFFPYFG